LKSAANSTPARRPEHLGPVATALPLWCLLWVWVLQQVLLWTPSASRPAVARADLNDPNTCGALLGTAARWFWGCCVFSWTCAAALSLQRRSLPSCKPNCGVSDRWHTDNGVKVSHQLAAQSPAVPPSVRTSITVMCTYAFRMVVEEFRKDHNLSCNARQPREPSIANKTARNGISAQKRVLGISHSQLGEFARGSRRQL